MTLVIGVGQAGCNLAAEMKRVPNASDFLNVYLFNSTLRDLVHINHVPQTHWVGVNERGLVILNGNRDAVERELSGGMGKNPRRCFATLNGVFDDIVERLALLPNAVISKERFAVVIFSGGGGTGAGAAPVIARAIRERSEGNCRIIGVFILPSATRGTEERAGSLRDAWNAWFSYQRSLEVFDGLVVVDNERLAHLGDVERGFPRFNEYVARCLTDMVLGNLTELVLPEQDELVVQQSDTMDVVTALSLASGTDRKPGVAAIGRASQLLQNPMQYLLPFMPHREPDFVTLNRLARDRLTLREEDGLRYEKSYLLVRAPSKVLRRAGIGREVSEVMNLMGSDSKRGEVIYGTALTKRPLASLTLAMTYGPMDHPRLKSLESDAETYEAREDVDDDE